MVVNHHQLQTGDTPVSGKVTLKKDTGSLALWNCHTSLELPILNLMSLNLSIGSSLFGQLNLYPN